MGHRDDLLVTRQYTRMTNAAGGPPTRSVCLLGFVQACLPATIATCSRVGPAHPKCSAAEVPPVLWGRQSCPMPLSFAVGGHQPELWGSSPSLSLVEHTSELQSPLYLVF